MVLNAAGKDLQLDVPVGIDGNDPRDLRVCVLVAHHHVAADRQVEAGAGVGSQGRQAPVVGHVHEVDGDLVPRHVPEPTGSVSAAYDQHVSDEPAFAEMYGASPLTPRMAARL